MSLTADQLAMRRTGLGASEVPIAAGLSPYETPFGLYLRKRGLGNPAEENEAMAWGHRLEGPICDWAAQKLRAVNVRASGTLRHPEHTFILATPDRFALVPRCWDEVLIEAKNAGLRQAHHFGEEGDAIPDWMAAQVQQQLEVTGCEVGYLAVLIGGNSPRLYEVRRDRALWASLLVIAREFWERVQRGDPPPVDGSERTRAWLSDRHPGVVGRERAATEEERELAETYARLRAEIAALEKAKDERGNRLRDLLGDAETVTADWGKVTWKRDKAGKPRWKDVAEEVGRTLAAGDALAQVASDLASEPGYADSRRDLAAAIGGYLLARGLSDETGQRRRFEEVIAAHTPTPERVLRVAVKK